MSYIYLKRTLYDRLSRNTACCKHRKERKQNEAGFPRTSYATGETSGQVEDNSGYQELGELSKPTIYEKLK